MKAEIPTGTHWSGREIPISSGKNIFEWLTDHLGEDILHVRELGAFWFDLTPEEFDYWLGEWRFTRR